MASWRGGLWAALCAGALGCDGEAEAPASCDALGQRLAVGERAVDPEINVECTCTADGPRCQPWDGTYDASGPSDGGRLIDAGAVPPDARAAADQGGAADAGPLDAATDRDARPPPPCPTTRPGGGCAAPDQQCLYGEPFTCCVRDYPAEQVCTCVGNRWQCVDHNATCLADPVGRACRREAQVCETWQRLQADRGADARFAPAWDGDVAQCIAGDMGDAWRQRALARLNDWRLLADLPAVTTTLNRDELAQACALAIHARGGITHTLTPADPCYSEDAARGAAESNVYFATGPIAGFFGYIADPGDFNFAGLPHRLWMLSNRLGPVGLGATPGASCMHVATGRENARRPFIAWPPAGPFPYDATLAETTGWSIQSDTINFQGATVAVTRDGEGMPVDVRVLQAQYGAAHGIAFIPQGWAPAPGEAYDVRVIGATEVVRYTVEFLDCGGE